MNTATLGVVQIRLNCRPYQEGKVLVFPYEVRNQGDTDAFIMDAVVSVDHRSRAAKPNAQSAVVLHGPSTDATVGKFIAPLPADRRMAMPVIPLARRLPPSEAFEGRLEIPTPLAETSPYFADLPLRQYEVVDISGVVFTLGYWTAGIDGLAALPVEYAPELFNVVTRNTLASARLVSQRFPVHSLQLFRRTDQFPRCIPGEPEPAWPGAQPSAEQPTDSESGDALLH
jgi:hypothetical protein